MEDYEILDYTAWTPLEQILSDLRREVIHLKNSQEDPCKNDDDNNNRDEKRPVSETRTSLLEWTTNVQSSNRWFHWLPRELDVIQVFPLRRDSQQRSSSYEDASHHLSEEEIRRWLSILIMTVHESGWLLGQRRTALVVAPNQHQHHHPSDEGGGHDHLRLFGKIYLCNAKGQLVQDQSLYLVSETYPARLLKGSDSDWIELFRQRWSKVTNLLSSSSSSSHDEASAGMIATLESVIEHRYRLVNWYDMGWKEETYCWISSKEKTVAASRGIFLSAQDRPLLLPSFLQVTWGPRQDPLECLEWVRQKSWLFSDKKSDVSATIETTTASTTDSIAMPRWLVPDVWQHHRWKATFRPMSYIKTPLKEALYQLWQASLAMSPRRDREEERLDVRQETGGIGEDTSFIQQSIQCILETEYYSVLTKSLSQEQKQKEGEEKEEREEGETLFLAAPALKGKMARPLTITYLMTLYLLSQSQQRTHHPSRWLPSIRRWWQKFLRKLRWHWEQRVVLCNIEVPAMPDYRTPLIHQKFQLLQYCIISYKRKDSERSKTDSNKEERHYSTWSSDEGTQEEEETFFEAVERMPGEHRDQGRRGIKQRLPNMISRCTGEPLYIPISLDPGFKTEDQIEEDHIILSNLGTSSEAAMIRARMQSGPLLSDMSAFKAANRGCCLEDFVRWHSPRDWIDQESRLSDRMATTDNFWRELWDMAEELPACEQRPLFDCEQEAEKVLHYLETLSLDELFQQVLSTAISIVRDIFLPFEEIIVKDPLLRRLMTSLGDTSLVPMETTLHSVHTIECRLSKSLSILHKLPPFLSIVHECLDDDHESSLSEDHAHSMMHLYTKHNALQCPYEKYGRWSMPSGMDTSTPFLIGHVTSDTLRWLIGR